MSLLSINNHVMAASAKLIGLLLLVCTLPACQHVMEQKTQENLKKQKLQEAVSYNVQLGMAYLKRGNLPRAKTKLLNALKLEPDSPDVNAAFAFYLEKTGEIDKAREHYQKAVNLAPTSGAQLNNYGTFLCRRNQQELAEKYFIKAANDPNYVNTAMAYENAGLCAASIPNETKAKAYFIKALHQDSKRKQALYELVKNELNHSRYKEALAYLNQYPQITLQDPILLDLAVKASHNLGNALQEKAYQVQLTQLNDKTSHTGEYNESYNG